MSFLDSLDPRVKEYMMKKREEEQALKEQTQGNVGQNFLAPALAAASAGFMGRDPMAAGMGMQQKVQADKDKIINNFQKEKAGELEGLNLSRQLKQDDIADQKQARELGIQNEEDDPNSQKSKMAQEIARSMGLKNVDNLTFTRFNSLSPVLQKKYELEQKKQENYLNRIAKTDKEKEMSVAQAKQKGLAEAGELANSQYEQAITKGAENKEYDPTSYADFIDNTSWAPNFLRNDAAIEADSAKSSWVESYLRDASGAAIPEPERLAYAKDYFPQPGDSKTVQENKAALRAQKEKNARISSGASESSIQKKQIPQEETKMIGKQKYKKVPGGWEEV